MYIELFLADNLLFNILICRLSSALCGRRLRFPRALGFSAAGAVYAAAAIYFTPLNFPACKLTLCLVMGMALPFRDAREYGAGVTAMFASAFIIGGLALFLTYATGGAVDNGALRCGTPLRLTLFIASAAAAMPSFIRKLRSRRLASASGELLIVYEGAELRLKAVVDSGNGLFEPVSGLPVAVACIPGLRGNIPVPAGTVQGRGMLYAIKPERAVFNGKELDMLVALCDVPVYPGALIPPAAIPDTLEGGNGLC